MRQNTKLLKDTWNLQTRGLFAMAFRITMMLVCLTLTGVVGCGGQGEVEFPEKKLDKAPDESAIDAFKAPPVNEDPVQE